MTQNSPLQPNINDISDFFFNVFKKQLALKIAEFNESHARQFLYIRDPNVIRLDFKSFQMVRIMSENDLSALTDKKTLEMLASEYVNNLIMIIDKMGDDYEINKDSPIISYNSISIDVIPTILSKNVFFILDYEVNSQFIKY